MKGQELEKEEVEIRQKWTEDRKSGRGNKCKKTGAGKKRWK